MNDGDGDSNEIINNADELYMICRDTAVVIGKTANQNECLSHKTIYVSFPNPREVYSNRT